MQHEYHIYHRRPRVVTLITNLLATMYICSHNNSYSFVTGNIGDVGDHEDRFKCELISGHIYIYDTRLLRLVLRVPEAVAWGYFYMLQMSNAKAFGIGLGLGMDYNVVNSVLI
jgi:hypothetical protein